MSKIVQNLPILIVLCYTIGIQELSAQFSPKALILEGPIIVYHDTSGSGEVKELYVDGEWRLPADPADADTPPTLRIELEELEQNHRLRPWVVFGKSDMPEGCSDFMHGYDQIVLFGIQAESRVIPLAPGEVHPSGKQGLSRRHFSTFKFILPSKPLYVEYMGANSHPYPKAIAIQLPNGSSAAGYRVQLLRSNAPVFEQRLGADGLFSFPLIYDGREAWNSYSNQEMRGRAFTTNLGDELQILPPYSTHGQRFELPHVLFANDQEKAWADSLTIRVCDIPTAETPILPDIIAFDVNDPSVESTSLRLKWAAPTRQGLYNWNDRVKEGEGVTDENGLYAMYVPDHLGPDAVDVSLDRELNSSSQKKFDETHRIEAGKWPQVIELESQRYVDLQILNAAGHVIRHDEEDLVGPVDSRPNYVQLPATFTRIDDAKNNTLISTQTSFPTSLVMRDGDIWRTQVLLPVPGKYILSILNQRYEPVVIEAVGEVPTTFKPESAIRSYKGQLLAMDSESPVAGAKILLWQRTPRGRYDLITAFHNHQHWDGITVAAESLQITQDRDFGYKNYGNREPDQLLATCISDSEGYFALDHPTGADWGGLSITADGYLPMAYDAPRLEKLDIDAKPKQELQPIYLAPTSLVDLSVQLPEKSAFIPSGAINTRDGMKFQIKFRIDGLNWKGWQDGDQSNLMQKHRKMLAINESFSRFGERYMMLEESDFERGRISKSLEVPANCHFNFVLQPPQPFPVKSWKVEALAPRTTHSIVVESLVPKHQFIVRVLNPKTREPMSGLLVRTRGYISSQKTDSRGEAEFWSDESKVGFIALEQRGGPLVFLGRDIPIPAPGDTASPVIEVNVPESFIGSTN